MTRLDTVLSPTRQSTDSLDSLDVTSQPTVSWELADRPVTNP